MNRLFLALPVTLFDYQSLQDDFADIIQGKWIPPQNLHLTLNFFGNTFEEAFLKEAISVLDLKSKSSDLKGLSILKHNNILYAQTLNDSLYNLHTQIQEAFMLPQEQEFIAHVTLMRIKKIRHHDLFERRLQSYNEKIIGTLHPKIQLIQSQITPTGAKYTLLKEF